jgi:transketolase
MSDTPRILGMRDEYFNALYPHFQADKRCIFLSADNGAPTMDQFSDLPGQFQQVGIAEQHMVAHAAGLALEGHRVIVYSIAAFLMRCFESIKVNMCAQRHGGLPITYVGIGPGFAYDIMGPTHHSLGCIAALRTVPNLTVWHPADSVTAKALANRFPTQTGPEVILFDRTDIKEQLHDSVDLEKGYKWLDGIGRRDVEILASGVMVHQARKVQKLLEAEGVSCAITDVFRSKPLGYAWGVANHLPPPLVVTYEEDWLAGGLGSAVAETFADHGIKTPLLRIGVPDEFAYEMGGREVLWRKYGLLPEQVAARIREALR